MKPRRAIASRASAGQLSVAKASPVGEVCRAKVGALSLTWLRALPREELDAAGRKGRAGTVDHVRNAASDAAVRCARPQRRTAAHSPQARGVASANAHWAT